MSTPGLLEADLGPRARGVFTTRGEGALPVSLQSPYEGCDLALHVGDDATRVAANRAELEAALGLGAGDIAWMEQVHSAIVAPAARGRAPRADALVLGGEARPAGGSPVGVAASGESPRAAAVMVADCVPVLIASSDGRHAAAVHAGRRGMLDGIVPAAIEALVRDGARVEDLWAATGPSICGRCYEVPEEMRAASAAIEPDCAATTRWGTPGVDVAAGVLAQLRRAGVGHVSAGHWCTYEDPSLYSYRRDGVTGRIAGIVVGA